MTSRQRRWRLAVLTGLLLLGAPSIGAQTPVRQVLVLQSFERGNLTLDQFTADFRVELDRLAGSPVNLIQVVVGKTGLADPPDQAIVNYIRSIFADRSKPDLIMTFAGPAASFARKYRPLLFPETPLLFAAVDRRMLAGAPLADNEAAITVANDFPRIVEDILQLLPQTRQLFMVMGSRDSGKFWHRELEEQFKRFDGRLALVWTEDLTLPELLRRSSALPRDAAIFYVSFGTDASGAAFTDAQVLAGIHAATSAPLFGVQGAYVGHGVVGGSVISVDDVARNTAGAVVRLLNGAPAASIAVPPQLPGPPVFDWRELQRLGIAESRLPPGSRMRYRSPNLWSQYRETVLGAAGVLFVQLLLIVGLLYQRRARQRAELDSRRHLALAADANRRQTMSALTSSIAHEVGQPLSAMIHNAQALQMMIGAAQATKKDTEEILADIRTQGLRATQIIDRHRTMLRSHQLDKKTIDLHAVITESLALVARDLESRRIATVVNLLPAPCTISGDQVLLQQVLVNLVMNAVDAMEETPPARRQITIGTEIKPGHVELSVRDTGAGFPEHLDGTIFTPFVTTKAQGMGIGLTIARTIVEGHGGTIDGLNNRDGGATFTITLPCSDTQARTGE